MTTTTNLIERLRKQLTWLDGTQVVIDLMQEAADLIEAQAKQIEALQADADWRGIATPPIVKRTNKPWDESERVVVLIRHRDETHEAFARYIHSEATGHEWLIEGHGGNWSNRVIGWLPLPARKGNV